MNAEHYRTMNAIINIWKELLPVAIAGLMMRRKKIGKSTFIANIEKKESQIVMNMGMNRAMDVIGNV
jgi:hypothetical protein